MSFRVSPLTYGEHMSLSTAGRSDYSCSPASGANLFTLNHFGHPMSVLYPSPPTGYMPGGSCAPSQLVGHPSSEILPSGVSLGGTPSSLRPSFLPRGGELTPDEVLYIQYRRAALRVPLEGAQHAQHAPPSQDSS